MYNLMVALFFVFLKVDLREVAAQARRPLLLTYLLAANLVVMPALAYLASRWLDQEVALGLVLLVALPSGVAATALTDMVKGRAALALVISVLSSIVAPFTIPAMIYLLFRTRIELSYLKLFGQLILMIAVPLAAAQLARRIAPRAIDRTRPYCGVVTIGLLSLIIVAVMGREADYLLHHLRDVVFLLVVLYVAFLVLQVAGYFTLFWLGHEDRLAASVAKMIMNNGLGIVLAAQFFSPRVLLLLILSEVPWSTMTVLYRFYRPPAA